MGSVSSYINTGLLFNKAVFKFLQLKWFLKFNYDIGFELNESLKKDYSYHSKYYNRAQQYIHANHFFGELLCMVRGESLRKEEIQRFVWLSSCAPVFDDFFEQNTDSKSLRNLMHSPDIEKANSNSEKLATHFFNQILCSMKNTKSLLNAADHLFEAQIKSKSQTIVSLSQNELLNISKQKGGYSGLMYAHLLNGELSKEFLQLAFELGSYGQLMDDVFDLYDDAKEGIRTFANQSVSVKEIRLIIEEQELIIFDLLDRMHLLQKDKKMFLNTMNVFAGIIEMALSQFNKNETRLQVSPSKCLQTERDIWIVDMEKASNIWKLFRLSSTTR